MNLKRALRSKPYDTANAFRDPRPMTSRHEWLIIEGCSRRGLRRYRCRTIDPFALLLPGYPRRRRPMTGRNCIRLWSIRGDGVRIPLEISWFVTRTHTPQYSPHGCYTHAHDTRRYTWHNIIYAHTHAYTCCTGLRSNFRGRPRRLLAQHCLRLQGPRERCLYIICCSVQCVCVYTLNVRV